MQIPQPKNQRSPWRTAHVAAALLTLPLAGSAVVLGTPSVLAFLTGREPGVLDVLEGPAVGWAERSRPWLEKVLIAPAERQIERALELGRSLASGTPDMSARAATLLGALAGDRRADSSVRIMVRGALMDRLEQREDTGARWSVGADIVSARALDALLSSTQPSGGRPSVRERLATLAAGPSPHPNLAVRVECAASALAHTCDAERDDEVSMNLAGFLLAVLRAETPDQTKSPRTWPRITTLAWVKTRSAETLARWTGTKNLFRPDGPWRHQTEEASRLESLLPQ